MLAILLIIFPLFALLLFGIFKWFTRARINRVDAPLPDHFPDDGFDHQSFQKLLDQFVNDIGLIDYARWHEDEAACTGLSRYIAAVQCYSPENAPERFPAPMDSLSYWINAYNALVIGQVLKYWPLKSVTDIKLPLETAQGMSFFYFHKHIVGGQVMSLFTLEQDKLIKAKADPRMHFLLNCASGSCPIMRPVGGTAEEMETLLSEAAADFVADTSNLLIEHGTGTIILSSIFKWYMSDFTHVAPEPNSPREKRLIAYLSTVAREPLKGDLRRAVKYKLIFTPFNWDINSA